MNELFTCGDTEITAVDMRINIGILSQTLEGSENIPGFQKQFEVRKLNKLKGLS